MHFSELVFNWVKLTVDILKLTFQRQVFFFMSETFFFVRSNARYHEGGVNHSAK